MRLTAIFLVVFSTLASAGLVPRNVSLWPNGVIPYTIDGTVPETIRQIIRSAVVSYDGTAVRFIERTTQADFVTFSVRNGNSSLSDIGRSGGQQFILLLPTVKTDTVIHEMGHAAGLMHEHMRGDRNYFVDVNWSNIPDEAYLQFISRPCDTFSVGAYDFLSIMHYSSREFAQNKLIPALTPKLPGTSIRNNQGLSLGDVQTLAYLYRGGVRPPPTATGLGALLCGVRNDFAPPVANAAAFVLNLYADVLHRAPDSAGFAGWLRALLSGASYHFVARAFLDSPERSLRLFDGAYRRCLGRTVDPVVVRGQSVEELLVALVGSPEFLARPGRLVDKAYVCVLGRTADAYASVISDSTTLARALVRSDEYVAGRVRGAYRELLHREAGPSEVNAWIVWGRAPGADSRAAEALISTSPEYLTRIFAR